MILIIKDRVLWPKMAGYIIIADALAKGSESFDHLGYLDVPQPQAHGHPTFRLRLNAASVADLVTSVSFGKL